MHKSTTITNTFPGFLLEGHTHLVTAMGYPTMGQYAPFMILN